MSYRYFTDPELACKCCGEQKMQPDFMRKVEALREACGFPFAVSSAYRCPKHNAAVSSSGSNGAHTTGRAIDIQVYGPLAHMLLSEALTAGFTGIGVSQKGAHGSRFIHLDDLPEGGAHPRPGVWSY